MTVMRTFLAAALVVALSSGGALYGQAVKTVPFGGKPVPIISTVPSEMIGDYLYERKGSPKFTLNADGTGIFEPHQRPGIPFKYWLMADDKGVAVKQLGQGNPNYGYTIIVQYGAGGDGNYPEGGYDGFSWAMDVGSGCAVVVGERFKC